MLIYELLEELLFKLNYENISNILNRSNIKIIKNKKIDNNNIDYNQFGIYKDLVIEFVELFKLEFNQEEINNMLKNLSTLKIKTEIPDYKFNLHYLISVGYYKKDENEIIIETDDPKQVKHTLFHELLHMSSRSKKGSHYLSGFNLSNMVGIVLNEDYTEYLIEEKFCKSEDYNPRYNIIKEFEYLIGKDKLQELYFKADLPNLIKELSKYNNKRDIIRLLYEYDGLYNFRYNYNKINKLENKIEKLIVKKEKQKVKKYMI